MQLTPAQVAKLAHDVGGWRGADLVRAVKVALAESGGKTTAVGHNKNGTSDRGLWQLNSQTMPDDSIAFDPVASTRFAAALWRRRGWAPWYGGRKADAKLDAQAAAAVGTLRAAGGTWLAVALLTLSLLEYSRKRG